MKQEKILYNQTQIANILGISKSTVSRYIKNHGFTATTKSNSKLYPETVIKQIRKLLKNSNNQENKHISTVQILLDQISQLKEENKTLKQQLTIKDTQIESLTQLANQAQHLDLATKKQLEELPKPKKHWWNK